MWATIFHILELTFLHIQSFCQFLGSGMSESRKTYWKLSWWQIVASEKKKCNTMIIKKFPVGILTLGILNPKQHISFKQDLIINVTITFVAIVVMLMFSMFLLLCFSFFTANGVYK